MRNRHISNALEQLNQYSAFFVPNPETMHGKWRWLFNNNHVLHLEIGCGKGRFIINQALKNPQINFIALERDSTILLKAIKKCQDIMQQGFPIYNLKFINADANKLEFLFDDNEVNQIYLNFSDPWPKKRQARRRLTDVSFLKQYYLVLRPHCQVTMKTDNVDLYHFSLEQIKSDSSQFEIVYQCEDLYKHLGEDVNQDNVPTEYEERFVNLSQPIYKIIFTSLKKI